METKRCKDCHELKSTDCFSIHSNNVDGLHNSCKVCFKIKYSDVWNKENNLKEKRKRAIAKIVKKYKFSNFSL